MQYDSRHSLAAARLNLGVSRQNWMETVQGTLCSSCGCGDEGVAPTINVAASTVRSAVCLPSNAFRVYVLGLHKYIPYILGYALHPFVEILLIFANCSRCPELILGASLPLGHSAKSFMSPAISSGKVQL